MIFSFVTLFFLFYTITPQKAALYIWLGRRRFRDFGWLDRLSLLKALYHSYLFFMDGSPETSDYVHKATLPGPSSMLIVGGERRRDKSRPRSKGLAFPFLPGEITEQRWMHRLHTPSRVDQSSTFQRMGIIFCWAFLSYIHRRPTEEVSLYHFLPGPP